MWILEGVEGSGMSAAVGREEQGEWKKGWRLTVLVIPAE